MGKVAIATDYEDRENEGTQLPAEMMTPAMVNFMITEGRGMLCAPVSEGIAGRLTRPHGGAKPRHVPDQLYRYGGCRQRCHHRCECAGPVRYHSDTGLSPPAAARATLSSRAMSIHWSPGPAVCLRRAAIPRLQWTLRGWPVCGSGAH